jgi:L-serine deaminase
MAYTLHFIPEHVVVRKVRKFITIFGIITLLAKKQSKISRSHTQSITYVGSSSSTSAIVPQKHDKTTARVARAISQLKTRFFISIVYAT